MCNCLVLVMPLIQEVMKYRRIELMEYIFIEVLAMPLIQEVRQLMQYIFIEVMQ